MLRQAAITLMPMSRKKVIVRRFDREWLSGYLPSTEFVQNCALELLNLAGKVEKIALNDVKWLCFVRDFHSGEIDNPERLLRKTFAARPRGIGVWLRTRLRDGETVEGLAANDLSLIQPEGLLLTPPDARSNTQRIFLPREAIVSLEVVAVLQPPVRKIAVPTAVAAVRQEELFAPKE